ncbi:hypothetical protein [Aquimarina algiphila]|uniref:Histidine kinase n=1 Tax=Aquimarina algiphila TaxID=2047982 RepID=A0A554VNK1_9FLAO|nr:hypothetical protein [Aquimarina algiphila]TSE09958.1 hypothetical protein FOF46_06545 [Aquimarina algiphila]
MFKEIISSKKYWKTVVFIGVGFIIVFSVIEHLMQYGGLSLDIFIEERISQGRWMRYFLSRVAGGLMYGMIMGYYFELRKRKSNR